MKLLLILKEILRRFISPIHVVNAIQTLEIIEREKKSISRFGDGEFDLILGNGREFQQSSPELQDRLLSILDDVNNEKCLIAIPYAFYSLKSYNKKSKKFWLYYCSVNEQIVQLLDNKKLYYDAQITRFYINRKNKNDSITIFEAWKRVWDEKNVLIVEGNKSRCGVENDIFLNCKKVSRILCPSENAFQRYDTILNMVLKHAGLYDLILVALGPTATVLAYDLAMNGFWSIDIGNMDNEYEWMMARVDNPIANKGKYSFEAEGGTDVEECMNEEYKKQIIEII